MYLMYVDECGDFGMGEGSSDFLVLSGLIVHERHWIEVQERVAELRGEINKEYGLPASVELHAGEMVGRSSREYSGVGKLDRLMILRRVIDFESALPVIRIINVVIDKRKRASDFDVFSTAWNALINRFESAIEHGSIPGGFLDDDSKRCEKGLIIVDQTDEAKLRVLLRRMRWAGLVSRVLENETMVWNDVKHIIEDPLHKDSKHSPLIQLCDVNSYFLKQMIQPNSTVKRHKATYYFRRLEPILLMAADMQDDYGIVWK